MRSQSRPSAPLPSAGSHDQIQRLVAERKFQDVRFDQFLLNGAIAWEYVFFAFRWCVLSGFRVSMYEWHESKLVMLAQELVNISCRSRLVFSHHHRIGTKFDGQSWFWNAAPGCVIHLQPLPLLSNTFFHWLSCVYGPLWSPTAAQVVGPLLLHARWHTNSFCDVEHDNGMMTSWPLAQPLGEAWQDLCTWHWRAGTPSYL